MKEGTRRGDFQIPHCSFGERAIASLMGVCQLGLTGADSEVMP
jgi:hypothetical protein